jgi:DNA processing protein
MPISGPRCVLGKLDDRYPRLLLDMQDPPSQLYVIGNPDALSRESISVIGARKATPYGIACARFTAQEAAAAGLQVISGAAVGCDQAAQEEALKRGASSVAVLGCGADVIFPSSSACILQRMVDEGGAVVSLLPWGTPPSRWAFVRRNPIIAALSRALVICEAGMPSGTFSTAHAAVDLGRDVLVYPGSFFSPNSRGSNYLISDSPAYLPLWDEESLGVALSRIYGLLVSPCPPKGVPQLQSDVSRRVYASLQAAPETVDSLARGLCVDSATVMRAIGDLASHGLVKRLADGRYSLTTETLLGARPGGRKAREPERHDRSARVAGARERRRDA